MAEKEKKNKTRKVVLAGLFGVFLLLIAFYQPILFGLVRIAASQVAKSQAFDLSFDIHGSIFTDLFVENLHLQPRPENHVLPLERLDARRIGLRYNLLALWKKKYLSVVDLVELKDVDAVIRPVAAPEQQPPVQPLRFPAVLPKRIDIRNLNVTVKNETGDFKIANTELQFEQGKDGYLACDKLQIPGAGAWNKLRAGLSYAKNRLVVSDLEVAPLFTLNRLQLDLTGSEQGTFQLSANVSALGASLTADAAYSQPAEGRLINANLKIAHFELAELQRIAPVTLTGTVPEVTVQLDGNIDHPRSLSGRIAVAARQVRYQNISIDAADAVLTMQNGKGTILESVEAGPNRMRANATFILPENFADLVDKTVANIGLAASIPAPGKEFPGLSAPTIVLGNVGLADGKAKAVLRTFSSSVSMSGVLPGAGVGSARTEIFAVAHLPPANNLWSSVAFVTGADIEKISYQDAHVAEVHAETSLTNGSSVSVGMTARSGESNFVLSADVPLPPPSEEFDAGKITGHLRFNVGSITDFITQEFIKGALTADGDIRFQGGQPAGTIRAQGAQLSYRGMNVGSLQIDTLLKDGDVNIRQCEIDLDPQNSARISGSVKLSEPFRFLVNGTVAFKDLSALNGFLQSGGAPPGIGGELQAKISASGDVHKPEGEFIVTSSDLKYGSFAVQNVDIKSAFKDSSFNVERCSVALDSNNHLDGHATVRIEEPHAFQAQAEVRLPDLARFDEILKSSHQPPGLSGGLNLDASASGDFTKPAATVQLRGDQIRYRGLPIDNVRMEASLKDAQVVFGAIQIAFDPNNQIGLTGKSAIAEPYRYEFKGTVGLGDLGVFNDFLGSLGQGGGLAGVLNLDLSGQGDSKNPTAKLSLRGTQISYRGVQVQTAEVESSVNDWICDIPVCRFTLDANNYIDLTARTGLKPPESYVTDGRIEFNNLAVFAGLLKSLSQPGTAAGELHAAWSGKGDLATLLPDAHLQVFGKDIKYRGLSIQKVDISGDLAQRNLHLPSCRLLFNDKNFVDASGNAKAEEPYDYEGSAKLQFDDLGFLNELAKSFGQDIGLGGKLSANWSGKGPVSSQTGNFDFHADKLRTKSFQDIKFDATGDYHGANAEIPALKISTPYADLDASINFSPEVLEIPSLSIRKNGNAINGNLKIPLDLRSGQKTPLALDQPIEVNLRGDKITLASFQPGKPSVTGTLGLQLQVSKTLRNPLIEFTLSAKDVRSAAVSSFSAAQADLSVRLAEKDLAIGGKVTQADIHPLELSGRMPIDVGQVLESGALPENTPIQLTLKWPSNNLAFVRKIVPDIKIIEGTADVDIEAKGTIKRPEVSGQIRSSIARFHAKTDTVPPLSDFVSTISFRQDRIQIDQLSGLAGGGRFSGTGSVDLKDGTNPKFDLGFKGNQVLLTRSDGIIVRANLDLSIRGPLSAGEVAGTVGVTNSRFFKDIDVLPLNLPGRPPPQAPAGAPPPISVTTPPFNAWKFNVAVRTDDPFLVQSNLARGQISIHLQAGGTGASPSVTGDVLVNRLVASLPFSKMEIVNGRIDFVQGANILDPTLSIIGRSTVRDYEVTLRIFGNVSKPTVLLDSAPPLAQGDILVLLATGSTTSEFAQDPSLIAGRATFIVLEQIFGKFFPSTNRADQTKEPFIDRFSVNVIPGRKAGEQEISTSFRLTKNWEILGDFGSGSYQGRLKYLVRFR